MLCVWDILKANVFVPLSGLASVNSKKFSHMFYANNVFVPLSGLASVNDYLKLYANDECKKFSFTFSSPYRG